MSLTAREKQILEGLLRKRVEILAKDLNISEQAIYSTTHRVRRKWRRAIDINNQMLAFSRRGEASYKKLITPKRIDKDERRDHSEKTD